MWFFKKFFDIFVQLCILCIVCSGIFVLPFIMEQYEFGTLHNTILIACMFFVQGLCIIFLVNRFYSKPSNELKKQILLFFSGQSKDVDLDMKTNFWNPNMNIALKFFEQILSSLRNIKEEFLNGKAIKWEVQLAAELQDRLLNKTLQSVPSLQVIAKSKPAGEVGWDSYDVILGRDENYYLYVWDATGHGVWAGVVMMMVNALISAFSKFFLKGSDILSYTNEVLKPRVKSNILMTTLLIRWNQREKRLFMTGAGHEYLILYKHELGKCFKIKSGWMALGMTKNVHKILKEQEVKFDPYDIAVLYTDGITESINEPKKTDSSIMFWEERIISAILSAPTLPGTTIRTAQSVFNTITIELSRFMWYSHVQLDDITLMVLHYTDKPNDNSFPTDLSPEFITEWNWDS